MREFNIILTEEEKDQLVSLLRTSIHTLNNGNYAGRNNVWLKIASDLRTRVNSAPLKGA